jgi:hypothetical protein
MPVTKVTCPECQSVIRPTKPLPEGKRVRCPRCGAPFVVPGGGARGPSRGAPPAKRPEPARRRARDDDDEADSTPYRFQEEHEDDGPQVDYTPDMSIRDLRGPASGLVYSPSNKLLIAGILGFLGWLGLLVVILIPVAFPGEKPPEGDRLEALRLGPGLGGAARNDESRPLQLKKEEEGFFQLGGLDLATLAQYPKYLFVLFLLPLVLGMAYSGAVAAGAVKMQGLESRPWAIAGAILAIIPYNAAGFMILLTMVLGAIYGVLFEGSYLTFMMTLTVGGVWVANVAVGVWCLVTLKRPEVIAGFQFRPE